MVAAQDVILFAILPYVAVSLAVIVSAYRYYMDQFSVSSLSSQLLEHRELWGSIPWHYGIMIILGAHIIAAALPFFWNSIISDPIRLYTMEITGWALAISLGTGLYLLIARRFVYPKIASSHHPHRLGCPSKPHTPSTLRTLCRYHAAMGGSVVHPTDRALAEISREFQSAGPNHFLTPADRKAPRTQRAYPRDAYSVQQTHSHLPDPDHVSLASLPSCGLEPIETKEYSTNRIGIVICRNRRSEFTPGESAWRRTMFLNCL